MKTELLLLLLLCPLCIGCSQTVAKETYRPAIEVDAAQAAMTDDVPIAPVVPADGTCPNCRGTGRVGDGTISVTCAVCDGTGKVEPETNPASFTKRDGAPVITKPIAEAVKKQVTVCGPNGCTVQSVPVQRTTANQPATTSGSCSDGSCSTGTTYTTYTTGRRGIFRRIFGRRR